jgi:hypothetical protein
MCLYFRASFVRRLALSRVFRVGLGGLSGTVAFLRVSTFAQLSPGTAFSPVGTLLGSTNSFSFIYVFTNPVLCQRECAFSSHSVSGEFAFRTRARSYSEALTGASEKLRGARRPVRMLALPIPLELSPRLSLAHLSTCHTRPQP